MKTLGASNKVSMGFYWRQMAIVIATATATTLGPNALYPNSAVAQITPDTTLPNNSNVNSVNKTFNITGGSQAGRNLFHSFKDFSVPTGWEAVFKNGADIQNILTRVTGKSISNIDGLIKANHSANLFLMNPNGIVFGENARLDIGGSFVGTSAESMKFSDGSEFSAVNPQSSPLLTINVPLGLQYGKNPGSIQVEGDGKGQRNFDSPIIDTQDALRVEADKTLALVGGDMNLEGATLKTAGGRIELGSVGGNSLVNLVPTDKGFILDYGDVANFRDIQLSQQANIDASGEGGGDIQVQARSLFFKNEALIQTITLREKQGGNLVVNTTESVEVIGLKAGLQTSVAPGAIGDGGDFIIKTGNLVVRDGALVIASTFGDGNGGNLDITAEESINLIGTYDDRKPNGLFTSAYRKNSTGNGGDLTIKTANLVVRDGAQISTTTFGAGNGGKLDITAEESINLIGTSAEVDNQRIYSGLFAQALPGSSGNGGNLIIQTPQLVVRDGAQIEASTLGDGNGGNLNIIANSKIQVTGASVDNKSSRLFAGAYSNTKGNGGDLTIQTGNLFVENRGEIQAGTFGEGNGGKLDITANQSIKLIDRLDDNEVSTGLFTGAYRNSKGNGGDLTIKTSELLVENGAQISTITLGEGNGGNLNINSEGSIKLIGRLDDKEISSGLFTGAYGDLTGNGGDLTIQTSELLVENGAQIRTITFGAGNGGNLNINSEGSIKLIGRLDDKEIYSTGLFTGTYGELTGNGGDLTIQTSELLVENGAQISTITFGAGNGGNLDISAEGNIEINGIYTEDARVPSSLFTLAASDSIGNGGDINIKTGSLFVTNNAEIAAQTSSKTTAGNVIINARELVELSGLESSLFSRTGDEGDAGTLRITTPELRITDNAQVGVNNFIERNFKVETFTDQSGKPVPIVLPIFERIVGSGNAGTLDIKATSVMLEDGGGIVAKSTGGDGGDIQLMVDDFILLRGNSSISSEAGLQKTSGNGGNIEIDTGFIIAPRNENSDIIANAFDGLGGNINITTVGLFGLQKRSSIPLNDTNDIDASSEFGLDGSIEITTAEINPTNGLMELPVNLVDPSNQISKACTPRGSQFQNTFVSTGRGGLPMNPTQPLQETNTLQAWVKLKPQSENSVSTTIKSPLKKASNNPKVAQQNQIVEATGWIVDRDGNIEFVAKPNQINPRSNVQTPVSCPVP